MCIVPYNTYMDSLAGLNATCRKNTMPYGQQERDALYSIAQAFSFESMFADWSSGGFLRCYAAFPTRLGMPAH